MAITYPLVLPPVFNAFLSYDTAFRFLTSFLLVFPLGFLLGIPFPVGLRLIVGEASDDVAWMWCINGVFSLLGSALALAVAMSSGFSGVLLLGGLTYLGVFLVGRASAPAPKGHRNHGQAKR